jgi:predicted nicotinamide N-methyase
VAEPDGETLDTPDGPVPLFDCRVTVGGRDWSVLHTGAVVSLADEARYLTTRADKLPYGVVLWPAALALAHEIVTRRAEFAGRTVLELGAGTGLPGLVAAAVGATVVQTDRPGLALEVCRRNGRRNRADGIEYLAADWADWPEVRRFDWVIGADVIYAPSLHPLVTAILGRNLAAGGRALLADPFRADGLDMMQRLEAAGWTVTFNRWTVGDATEPRPVAVYQAVPPG